MNIGLVSEKYPPAAGGLAVSASRLARGLAAQGHGVRLLTITSQLEAGQAVEALEQGVSVLRLGVHPRSDDSLAAWFDLVVAAHRRQPFDLLHGFYLPQAGFIAAYAGRFLGLPAVVSARGNDLDRSLFDAGKAAHILYALQQASAVTGNSQELVAKARALAPGQRVVCIPNGVDAGLFQPGPYPAELVAQHGLAGMPVLGFSGEARAKKGLAVLLLAFQQVAGRRSLALLLAGGVRSGADRELVKVFQKQNPQLRLVVLPAQPLEDMPQVYALMDVLTMPSLHDGLPNAVLEGLACQRAIVATPAGGLADVLCHEHNALLVPPGDAPALAAAIERLLDDAPLRQRLGAQGRLDVLAGYTPEREIAAYTALYQGLE